MVGYRTTNKFKKFDIEIIKSIDFFIKIYETI